MTVPIPITLARPEDVVPVAYVVHKKSQICLSCGTLHEWSETYALNHLRSRTGAGKYVRHLVPIVKPTWNVPLQLISMERREVFACHECISSTSLSHLPLPPIEEEKPVPLAIQGSEVKKSASTKKIVTLDDLA